MARNYAREFPHQVRLANAGGWRTAHSGAALRSVAPRSVQWWSEGSDVDGSLNQVWGFQRLEDLARTYCEKINSTGGGQRACLALR